MPSLALDLFVCRLKRYPDAIAKRFPDVWAQLLQDFKEAIPGYPQGSPRADIGREVVRHSVLIVITRRCRRNRLPKVEQQQNPMGDNSPELNSGHLLVQCPLAYVGDRQKVENSGRFAGVTGMG